MPRRHIDYMRVDELATRGDVRNPKGHDIEEMRASVQRFGYTEPILLDERTGKLVAGHGRVETLLALELLRDAGAEELPDGLDVDDDGFVVAPVTRGWSSRDDTEAGAYLVASNRLTERGGWRGDPLATLLAEVAASEQGLAGVGYGQREIEDMLATLGPVPDLEALTERHGEPEAEDFWPTVRIKLSPERKAEWDRMWAALEGSDDERAAAIIGHVTMGRVR